MGFFKEIMVFVGIGFGITVGHSIVRNMFFNNSNSNLHHNDFNNQVNQQPYNSNFQVNNNNQKKESLDGLKNKKIFE